MALLLVYLGPLPLGAQTVGTAAIGGEIRDEQGKPMAGATIVIRSQQAQFRRETRTDEAGRFHDAGFSPGQYHLLVMQEGQILWWFPVTLPANQERLQVEIDLKQLREAARERMTLSAELQERRENDREAAERMARLMSHYNLGARYLQEQEAGKAIEEFQSALAMEPDRGSTYAMLGQAYTAAGQPQAALEAYQEALSLDPSEAAHHNNLATLLANAGRLDEAMERFRRAAQLDSERSATYQFNLGAALLNAGRPRDALPLLRQASRTDPTLSVAHFFLGVALLDTTPQPAEGRAGEPLEAPPGSIEAFQRYLQLEPDGEYSEPARRHLERLGAPATDMLLPAVPSPEDF